MTAQEIKEVEMINIDQIERQANSGTLAPKGWRIHGNHNQETKAVKDALIQAGYANVRVKHGTGTAWGWLHIYADAKPNQSWQEMYSDIIRIAQRITGRHGDYNGNINVN